MIKINVVSFYFNLKSLIFLICLLLLPIYLLATDIQIQIPIQTSNTNISTNTNINHDTTYNEEFEDYYQIHHINHGNNLTYPILNKYVIIFYKGYEQKYKRVFDSSNNFIFRIGSKQENELIICWKNLLYRMSKGERIVITCPSNHAYGGNGYYDIVKPNEDVNFEIEMIEAVYDPFNITFISKSMNTNLPIRNDYLEYEILVWEYIKKDKLLMQKVNTGLFDIGNMFECIEEALRIMTIDDVVKIKCENKYGHLGSNIEEIPANIDLEIQIKLLSINKHLRNNTKSEL